VAGGTDLAVMLRRSSLDAIRTTPDSALTIRSEWQTENMDTASGLRSAAKSQSSKAAQPAGCL
jgi:hypothetical protein